MEYCLSTEAEWKYTCRAGTTTLYSFGDDASKLGQHAWNGKNANGVGEKYTHRVGQKLPNAWGLFDMHGNVAEWTLDCWNPGHHGGPVTGVARIDGNCARRVVKGGGWSSPGWRLRSAARRGEDAETRNTETGFRVVRTLD